MFFMFISIIIVSGMQTISTKKPSRPKILARPRKFFTAESGVEDMAYRIIKGKQYNTTEILSLGGYFSTTTVANTARLKK